MPHPPVFRFAPSPNGRLHLGHAYSALVTAGLARAAGGRVLLRIEDIDTGRCRPDYEAAIFDDLAWLGVAWETPVLRQSARLTAYGAALDTLRERALIYPCFATRGEIIAAAGANAASRDPDSALLYPGLWRGANADTVEARLSAGNQPAWRIDMARAAAFARSLSFTAFDANFRETIHTVTPEIWGDAVLARKDISTSYHLAVVVDDAAQGVTHVTRGEDLQAATHLHRLLQALLGLPAPLYHHHALVLASGGRKLAKSTGDRALRDLGLSPAQLRQKLAQTMPLP